MRANKPIEFEVRANMAGREQVEDHTVHEIPSGRQCARYSSSDESRRRAERHAENLRAFHVEGRKAQGVCVNSEECDRDRICVTLAEFKKTNLVEYVVLCERHRARLDAA